MFTVADETELPQVGRNNSKWKRIITEVKKQPNVWLKLDQTAKNTSTAYSLRKYGVEVRVATLGKDLGYTVFVRYTPEVSEQ